MNIITMNIITSSRVLMAAAALCVSVGASAQAINNNKADQLDYQKEITESQFNQAYEGLNVEIGQALSGIYGLRGGKNGEMPGSHAYQFEFCLGPDNYVQYACVTHTDFPYSNFDLLSTYNLCKGSIGGPGGAFSYVRQGVVPILNDDRINNIPELKAIYLLLYDYAAIENVDLFGPVPYNDFKNDRQQSPFTYNDMRTVYYTTKANIDDIVKCLDYYTNRPSWYKEQVNGILQGQLPLVNNADFTQNLDVYKRFANSLKLRMAMHISSVEPQTAQRWAEEAVQSGVIETINQQVAMFPSLGGFNNPLAEIWSSWNDSRLGASFESLLQSLDHPYLKYFFQSNSDPIIKEGTQGSAPQYTEADTRVVGMRCGTHPGTGQSVGSNSYIAFSKFDQTYFTEMRPPLYIMKLAEVQFLRAEGALRGWNMGGTAQEFYEAGIRNAYFENPDDADWDGKYKDYVDAYMNQTSAKDYTYVDPTGQTPDMPSVTKIGVKWNESLDRETKLEMIITQKYIAQFPYSFEPWVDLRRTGYPKLFPVLNVEDGDGSLNAGDMIRRIPWASDDPTTLKDLEATAIPALGGPDRMSTRLWWDTGVNFPSSDGISTVKDHTGSAKVFVADGQLYIEGADRAWVYDATGRLVSSMAKPAAMRLNKGIYVVKTQNGHAEASQKVVVK